jgi:hypothetical protein
LPRAQCRAGHYPTVEQKFSPRWDSQSIVFGHSHTTSRVDAESVWDEAEGRLSDGLPGSTIFDIRRPYPTFVPVWLLGFYALARLP